jgi:alpha-tubulin suppressor-like RCC1 family protein
VGIKKKIFLRVLSLSCKIILFIIISLFIFNNCGYPTQQGIPVEVNKEFLGQIAYGFGMSLIKPDSSLWTWGNIILGEGNTPKRMLVIPKASAIDMWEGVTIIVDKNGNLWYRGGVVYSGPYTIFTDTPVVISKLDNINSIACTFNNVYVLKNDGTVWILDLKQGKETQYQLPVKLTDGDNIIKISKALALHNDGTLFELEKYTPEQGGLVSEVFEANDLQNSKGRRTFILKKDGTVWGWGDNGLGVLGDGTTTTQSSPVKVKELSGIVKLSCNFDYNLALKNDGTVWFWGYTGLNSNNVHTSIQLPQKIIEINDVILMYAYATCYFMKKDGTYWYYNVFTKEYGQVYLTQ